MPQQSLPGLGELDLLKKERRQAPGGRIDFLMADPDDKTRYEIEIMLGELDASHIIRTIEYWDIERQRDPDLEHCAVIVAEEVTARFFNVIRLLNRAVPIIAIQLSAFQIGDEVVLHFTRVLRSDLKSFSAPYPSQTGITTCLANKPSVTALNLELRLPRSVRGPVERLALLRLAWIFLRVAVLTMRTQFCTPSRDCQTR